MPRDFCVILEIRRCELSGSKHLTMPGLVLRQQELKGSTEGVTEGSHRRGAPKGSGAPVNRRGPTKGVKPKGSNLELYTSDDLLKPISELFVLSQLRLYRPAMPT